MCSCDIDIAGADKEEVVRYKSSDMITGFCFGFLLAAGVFYIATCIIPIDCQLECPCEESNGFFYFVN